MEAVKTGNEEKEGKKIGRSLFSIPAAVGFFIPFLAPI